MKENVSDFMKKDRKNKFLYLENLEKKNNTTTASLLIEIMENETDISIKEKILLILSNLIEKSDYKILERMFLSTDAFTRNGAIEIIKNSKVHCYSYLEKLSKHENKDIRKFVLDSLKEDPSEEALKIIASRLDDPEINIKITAIEYLGYLGAEAYADKIVELLLKETDILLKCTALESLSLIGHKKNADKIVEHFNDEKNPVILISLMKYLGAVGESKELEILLNIINSNKNLAQKEFIDALESIINRIGKENIPDSIEKLLTDLLKSSELPPDKYEIIKILSYSKESKDKLKTAREKLNSSDLMEVLSAIEIIGEAGTKEDIETLEQIADQTDSDEILEAIGDAITRLTKKAQENS